MNNASLRKRQVGARMKRAAQVAGYMTTITMGEAMGVAHGNISRWWRGEQLPNVDEMDRYGEMVGKPSAWFYMEDSDDTFDYIADAVTSIFEEVMRGATIADAFDKIVTQPDRFNSRERRQLIDGTPALRAAIKRMAGLPWADLTSDDKRKIAEVLAEEVLPEILRDEAQDQP